MNNTLIPLQLIALSPSASQKTRFVVVLATTDEKQRLPIIIGQQEAEAIAIAVEQLHPVRPLAYDSWLVMLQKLDSSLRDVVIERVEEDVFYATTTVLDKEGQAHSIDIRPSDALALAIRCQAPIYTKQAVLDIASFQQGQLEKLPKKGSLTNYSLVELETLLERLLAKEDYQSAARIRDLIERRKT